MGVMDFLPVKDAFTELGYERNASYRDYEARKQEIESKWQLKAALHGRHYMDLGVNVNQMRRLVQERMNDYPVVRPSRKRIDEWVMPEFFVAARLMVQAGMDKRTALGSAFESLNEEIVPPRTSNVFGLEIELGRPRMFQRRSLDLVNFYQAIDAAQDIGVTVVNDSAREITLGKSRGVQKQLIVVRELINLGLLRDRERDQSVGIHINASGIRKPESHFAEIALLHFLFSSTDLFGISRIPYGYALQLPQHSHKHSTRVALSSVRSPLVFKENGAVEFMGIFKKWNGLAAFSKALYSFESVYDSARAYLAGTEGIEPLGNDVQLSEQWSELTAWYLEQIAPLCIKHGVPAFESMIPGFERLWKIIELGPILDRYDIDEDLQYQQRSKAAFIYAIGDDTFWNIDLLSKSFHTKYEEWAANVAEARAVKDRMKQGDLESVNSLDFQTNLFLRFFAYLYNDYNEQQVMPITESFAKLWGLTFAASKEDWLRVPLEEKIGKIRELVWNR